MDLRNSTVAAPVGKIRRALLVGLTLAFFASLLPARGRATTESSDAVAAFLGEIDELSGQAALSDAKLIGRFQAIATRHFDRRYMAVRALGRHIEDFDSAQFEEYFNAYDRHTEIAFVMGVRKYGVSVSEVLGTRLTPGGTTVVITAIYTASQRRDVVWHMCQADLTRVCDTAADGVRVSNRERTLFTRVLATGGMPLLLRDLRSGRLVEIP